MNKRILLIIGGGIASYKALFLIRVLARRSIASRVILTKAGSEFVTALAAGGLSGDKVYCDLFDLTDEAEMGHIQLSRSADLVVVAPATADLLAKAAHGLANDLASTTLLATDKRILFAPAMNVRMWEAPTTQRNIQTLKDGGCLFIGPDEGDMACGEYGFGRMAEPEAVADAVEVALRGVTAPDDPRDPKPLQGKHALLTAGPTREPIDPVRYLSNYSSGKQGYAIAGALAESGAHVTLVSGPVALGPPHGVDVRPVETARDMLTACEAALPADIFISVAAVADWRPAKPADQKIKKSQTDMPALELTQNVDILATLSKAGNRPDLVIGFAAETHNVINHARAKLTKKGCDWIIANDISGDVMGGDHNRMILVTPKDTRSWPLLTKTDAARKLVSAIVAHFQRNR
ncbi:MAG: bifunctional phosphopantothenoylcysteine decarboxylase/phosphopantothenate--cysteine ligase CoaBC [Hyphomonadaceae bacterium]|nr:bifunctional phosphopantothenoylcysteine decarboxylase/phosphopantothenate--cysteine ligase CoaBC [Hyphomonadaceae bacterium]